MSEATFKRAWDFLQSDVIEGGGRLSDDPDDPGGLTKWGISQAVYPDEDIAHLSEARAQFLFERDYWVPCRCADLPDSLAIVMGDAAFNQGPETAIKLLQRTLGVTVDGIMGHETLTAAQQQGATMVNDLLSRRLLRYADGNPKFRRGWFLRILRLKDAL